ncbi:MAG: ribosome recycling factor [Paludibacter sp.]|nr:ribosome recycling factor [Bacteroidales bacterium]MCM1068359.1 ribosome recycling factor [Prevotella sp.]MCM1354013.1 ribosome recycling factor [Bacteroides sp.]MCM1442145.1 ribosome recycling factor [Muribaculum sp.]MCM1481962.1 ribosome recycling factor [Paludibacter sp.]
MIEPEVIQTDAEELMQAAVMFLEDALAHIRAGKASARILDPIKVDYYGAATPLANVATITTPDARTICIQPWEKKLIGDIERAIINSSIGLAPSNNGEMIRLSIPPLTEDRRRELAKQCRGEAENAKVSVRNARRDAIDKLKKQIKEGLPEDAEKDAENEMQKVHDKYIKQIDELLSLKEKEIMTV